MSSADNICKQFRPRSSPTQRSVRSGFKLFDAPIVLLTEFFKILIIKKVAEDKKACKLPSSPRANLGLDIKFIPSFLQEAAVPGHHIEYS